MILCFMAPAVGCLTPRRRPSSTEDTPFFAVTIRWMVANQSLSGSLVAWKIVPAVGDVYFLQRLHWEERPTRQLAMPAMTASGADGAVRPAQPNQRRAALFIRAEGVAKGLVAQPAYSRCHLERHVRDLRVGNILRTHSHPAECYG